MKRAFEMKKKNCIRHESAPFMDTSCIPASFFSNFGKTRNFILKKFQKFF